MKRLVLIILGWVCVSLGFVGIFVPGIPTTIFLIIALWAFTKSSEKLRYWLLNHKRFGPMLRNWESHKVVPQKAKILMKGSVPKDIECFFKCNLIKCLGCYVPPLLAPAQG